MGALGLAPTAATSVEELLDYNKRGALVGLLAIEEHLQQLPMNADRSWCVKKHALLVCDHHLAEAVNHASRRDQRKAEACRRLRVAAEAVLRPGDALHLPKLEDVSRLRNQVREVFSDPTMADESCSICSRDANLGGIHPLHPNHPYRNGPATYGLSGTTPWYRHWHWHWLALAAAGAALFLARSWAAKE
jgi:hypothetical protein